MKGKIDFYSGERQLNLVANQIILAIKKRKKIAILMDSEVEIKSLLRRLKREFPELGGQFQIKTQKLKRIDSDPKINKILKPYLKKQELFSLIGKDRKNCLTDCEILFGLFFGFLIPREIRELLRVYPRDIPIIIWSETVGQFPKDYHFNTLYDSISPEEIHQKLFGYNYNLVCQVATQRAKEKNNRDPNNHDMLNQLNEMMNEETRKLEDPVFEIYAQRTAKRNYQLRHLKKFLKQELIDEGYSLSDKTLENLN